MGDKRRRDWKSVAGCYVCSSAPNEHCVLWKESDAIERAQNHNMRTGHVTWAKTVFSYTPRKRAKEGNT